MAIRWLIAAVGLCLIASLVSACSDKPGGTTDAGPDAGEDAGPDAGEDAGSDAGQDAGPP